MTGTTSSPLLPLAILLFTGLYLFVLPYLARLRGGRGGGRGGAGGQSAGARSRSHPLLLQGLVPAGRLLPG